MTEIPLHVVISLAAFMVAATVGLLGLRVTRQGHRVTEIEHYYVLQITELRGRIHELEQDIHRHQLHVDRCEAELTKLRQELRRFQERR